jgi:hypothetical protein
MIALLPDDPQAAEWIVRLMNENRTLDRCLDRTLHERNTWRENYLSVAARLERLGAAQAEAARLIRQREVSRGQ